MPNATAEKTPALVINADGGCNPNPGRGTFGCVAREPDGTLVCRMRGVVKGRTTNNVAEWRAALAALDFALSNRQYVCVELRMDSRLVVQQLRGRWRVKNDGLRPLAAAGKQMLTRLRASGTTVDVVWVPRSRNAEADRLT